MTERVKTLRLAGLASDDPPSRPPDPPQSGAMPRRVDDDAILDAVVAMVVAHGYAGATTRQIASAAGVNEVTLFRRFGNKRQMVLAAVHRSVGQLGERAFTASGDLEADLLQVLEYYVALFRSRASLPLVLILEASRNPELEGLLREPLGLQIGLRSLIEEYQRSGRLVSEPPAQAANALLGPVLAYGVDVQLGIAISGGPPQPAELLDRFLRGHALTPPPPSHAR
jgi:AcrR family transcriptional regulator